MTDASDSPPEHSADGDDLPDADPSGAADTAEDSDTDDEPTGKKWSALRESLLLAAIALLLYYLVMTFGGQPFVIPSESMEPTLHGCQGCVGDRIMVDKITYRFSKPAPGDVIVFRGPPAWNVHYSSIRSRNPVLRAVQNALSALRLVPPDENFLVKRIIAVGGQTVQCRVDTGLTVDGKRLVEPYLDPKTIWPGRNVNAADYPCVYTGGSNVEFGPVKVPEGRLWVMGDNRSHSADSRAHCANTPEGAAERVLCTGDPEAGTIPVSNVIGKTRFVAWPPTRWRGVAAVNPQGS